MEEDIKVLEHLINIKKELCETNSVSNDTKEKLKKEIQAIENLLKEYREQQEYIKELESKDYQERLDN